MSHVYVSQFIRDQFTRCFSGGFITQMTVPACDALLDAPGSSGILLEELQVIIRFQYKRFCRSHSIQNHSGGMAQISEEPNVSFAGPDQETHRILRIMWD
jgi:hypothetical protein